uniref:START domain containing protein n=1 Tax=Entamoeba histolytica TaxID=5759 RepID=S0AZF3_ENTHI|nr:START domain containing protein [Entamoeba histolytica]
MSQTSIKPATKAEFEEFVKMCTTSDKWNEVMKTDKIQEWMIDGGSDTLILRLTSIDFVGITPETVFDTLVDPDYRGNWDSNLLKRETFETLNESNVLIYYQFKMPVVSNRDYVFRQSTRKVGDDYILYNFSVVHDKFPPNPKFVRASFSMSGYYIQKTENGSKVTCIANNNCGGSLPPFLVNSQAKNVLPKTMDSIKVAATKYNSWKEKHNPDVKPWRNIVEPTE